MDQANQLALIKRGYLATKHDIRAIDTWLNGYGLASPEIAAVMQDRRAEYVALVEAFEAQPFITDDEALALPNEVIDTVSEICHDLVSRLHGYSGTGVLRTKQQVNQLANHFGFGGVTVTEEDLSYSEQENHHE